MRHSGSLYITLKLPISSQKHLFSVYQVTTFPSPLNHSSSHTTHLLKFNTYLIISKDVRYFAELSQTTYEQCHGQRIKHCCTVITQQSSEDTTCITKILLQQTRLIGSLCDFHYRPKLMLVSKISSLAYSCGIMDRFKKTGL